MGFFNNILEKLGLERKRRRGSACGSCGQACHACSRQARGPCSRQTRSPCRQLNRCYDRKEQG